MKEDIEMTRLVLMILSLIGMGYSVIVGLIETFKAIVGPAEVLPTMGVYAVGFIISLIFFLGFAFHN